MCRQMGIDNTILSIYYHEIIKFRFATATNQHNYQEINPPSILFFTFLSKRLGYVILMYLFCFIYCITILDFVLILT